jgi:hypothetical protein
MKSYVEAFLINKSKREKSTRKKSITTSYAFYAPIPFSRRACARINSAREKEKISIKKNNI